MVWLTVIGLINSAVASYYYLRLIVVMYMREPVVAEPPAPASGATRLALVLAAIATIYLGVIPGRVLDSAERSAKNLSGDVIAKDPHQHTVFALRSTRNPSGTIVLTPLTRDGKTTLIPVSSPPPTPVK
jgi:formate hydrogenlyase subunit 3/multisubunit Na+/H+ antiporter MnhD subunit